MQPRFIMHKHLTSVSVARHGAKLLGALSSMREPHVGSINRKCEYKQKMGVWKKAWEGERESLTLPMDYKLAFVHKYCCYWQINYSRQQWILVQSNNESYCQYTNTLGTDSTQIQATTHFTQARFDSTHKQQTIKIHTPLLHCKNTIREDFQRAILLQTFATPSEIQYSRFSSC